MLFPTGMNHQEQQHGSQGPYLPEAAGCSHAASPTSASGTGTGRCQTPAPAGPMETHPSRSEGSKPLLLAEASTPARPYGAGTRQRHSPSPCSRRGSVTLSVPASRSPAGQVFPSNSHIPPSPLSTSKGKLPLSLARTLQILERLKGKAEVALSWFSPRLLCFFVPQRSVRAWKVIF